MRNKRLNDWLTQAFGLGPIAFGRRIDRQLRKEISFTEFSKQLHERLDPAGLAELLPLKTVSWLYEIALRARVEKETVTLALRWAEAWRKSQTRTDNLVALFNAYPSFDPERVLRRTFGSRKGSRTRRTAEQLLQNLRYVKYQFKWWSRFAVWGPWRDSYRGYLVAMDYHLRKRFRGSLKKDRGEVIEVVVDTTGLNHKASAESILRALRREARKKKSLERTDRATLKP